MLRPGEGHVGVVEDDFQVSLAVMCVSKRILHFHYITAVVRSEVVIAHSETGVSNDGGANVRG